MIGGAAPRPKDRWILLAILVLAFGLRLVAVLQYEARHPNAAHPVIDEASYDRWARGIAAGDWLGEGVFFQEPLYPYALGVLYALFGPERLVARVAQALAWAVTAVLAGLLGRRLFGRGAGFCAALLLALHGPGMIFPSLLLKENLFLPLFTALALVLVDARLSRRRWLAVGILGGLGALLRGNMLVLLPALALWPWLARARGPLVRAGLVLAGAACVLLPVAVRNLWVGGVFLPTTSGAGTNLYGGNNLENPYGRASEFSFLRGIPGHEAGDWRREAERRSGRALDPGEVSSFWRGEALRSFREHPGEHLAILWNKLRLSLGSYEVPDNHFLPWDARFVPIARLPWPGFGTVGTLGLAGIALLLLAILRGPAREQRAAVETGLLLLLYLGTVVLTVTSDRARLPLVPLLAPFAGFALVWAGRAFALRDQEGILKLAFGLFLGAMAVHARVLPADEIARDFDERDFNLAAQWRAERPAEARAIAARLLERHPRSARIRVLLAEIDAVDAGPEELERVLAGVESLADEPDLVPRERFRARSLVAWLELRLGRLERAERRFREARAFDADDRDLREGLARALIGQGGRERLEEALALLADPGGDAGRVLLAQAEAELGRTLLEQGSPDEAGRGEALVQSALDRIRPVAVSTGADREARMRGRLLAGSIQLWRGNLDAAENQFRAAETLGGGEEARAGLARVAERRARPPPR